MICTGGCVAQPVQVQHKDEVLPHTTCQSKLCSMLDDTLVCLCDSWPCSIAAGG
jgi:hypothetical protein